MSLLTPFLKLFKWDTTNETDLNSEFNVDKSMNDNWDKLDEAIEDLDTNKVDKVDGKGLSTNDYTNEDKAKLDSLENYDDTEITQEIEDIQAKDESQDTEIDKQSDLIQKLKDNCINVTTDEATSLHVTDASILPAKLDVRGNQRQEAREGYNVLQNKLTSTTINGVAFTINEDKSITLNGTATNSIIANLLTGQYNDNDATSPLIIPDNITNYRLSGCPSGGSWSTYKLDIYAEDNELIATDLGEGANIQKESDTILNLLRVRIIVYAGAVLNNVTFYPMIIYGAENKPYEQYGASPSLDYPSKVRAVGDNVNILPIDTEYFEITENGIKNKDSSTGKTITEFTIKKGQTIKIGFIAFTKPSENTTFTCQINDIENSSLNIARFNNFNLNQKYEFSYTAVEDVVFKYVLNGNSANEIFEFQLWAQINELSNYSKYGQGSVEIKKLTENVIDLSKSVALYNTEITEIDKENGIIKVHRTNTQDPSIQIFCNLPAGQYTMLHNSHNFGQVSVYGKNKIVDIGSEKYKIFNATENITDIRIYSESELPTDYKINFSDIILVMGNVAREDIKYVKYQESSYILDIQQPMLSGDYFVKEADGWKEVHIWNKLIFTGQENWNKSGASTDEIFVATLDIENGVDGYGYSNYFRYYGYVEIGCFSVYNNGANIRFCVDSSVISDINRFKTMLADKYASGDSVYVYYKLSTPNKLACTEAQSNILDQLSELPLFAGTNNIITAESLALMQMQYIADTETYIDNRIDEKLTNINQQILNIVGGN